MSNISRRKFLKGAGAAALAVAAAGVLAGCKKDDIPDVPGVTTKEVVISYIFVDENLEVGTQKLTVSVLDSTVPAAKLDVPADYKLVADVKEYPIEKDNTVKVEVTGTKEPVMNVGINFVYNGSNLNSEEIIIQLKSSEKNVPVQTLKDLLEGMYPEYELAEEKNADWITMGVAKIANVTVVKKA